MQHGQSKDYFQRRADEERAAAEKAVDERAAQSHRELSDYYQNIARGSEDVPSEEAECSEEGILPRDFRIVP